jgi:hypothetical protein
MPANTPIYGFPYPLGTDPVSQGDNDIRALAEDIESVITPIASTTLTSAFSLIRSTSGNSQVQVGGVLAFTPTVGRRYRVSFYHPELIFTASFFGSSSTQVFNTTCGYQMSIRTTTSPGSDIAVDGHFLGNVTVSNSLMAYQLDSYWQPTTNTPVSLNVLAYIELSLASGGIGNVILNAASSTSGPTTLTVYDLGSAIV